MLLFPKMPFCTYSKSPPLWPLFSLPSPPLPLHLSLSPPPSPPRSLPRLSPPLHLSLSTSPPLSIYHSLSLCLLLLFVLMAGWAIVVTRWARPIDVRHTPPCGRFRNLSPSISPDTDKHTHTLTLTQSNSKTLFHTHIHAHTHTYTIKL